MTAPDHDPGLTPLFCCTTLAVAMIMALGTVTGIALTPAAAAPPIGPRQIPALAWQPRSDWINVKTDVIPAAVGDGVADDTAALQQALDRVAAATREDGPGTKDGSTLYFPAGTYRITRPLSLTGPIIGLLLVGCGRDTRLVWDGAAGGHLLQLNGVAYSSFVGLALEGRGKAAVGLYYRSDKRFQTEVTHRHLSFSGFAEAGILDDPARAQALAETTFENCLFEDCRRGVVFPQFNDYDYTFDGCEFRRCETGIECVHGNFYVRNCHFENSRNVDIQDGSEHGSSVRRCTSTGSNAFLSRSSSVAPITIQDCHVDRWKNPAGAILLSRPPTLLFDCVFTNPPLDAQGAGSSPVHAHSNGQRLIVSANRATGAPALTQADTRPQIYVIPAGRRSGAIRTSGQTFLRDTARIPRRVFDTKRDFGAKGDGTTDDTAAIQRAIDAAAAAAGLALAYLPTGRYVITQTLRVTGRDYFVGGSGWATKLIWKGPAGGTMVEVRDPQRVTLENLAIGNDDGAMQNAIDIRQVGSARPSHMTYDGVYVYGMYQKQPFRKGLWFENLGTGDTVVMPHVQGNLHFVDCGRATVLAKCSYEGSVVVEGKAAGRTGLLGFQTRLATIVTYGLYLRDSHNIVMSDFYVEQSASGYRFEGAPTDPPGRATIQGAKVEFTVPKGDPAGNSTFDIRNYHGQIVFGPDQFYVEPKVQHIRQQGAAEVALTLLGCAWYDSKPDVQLGPAARLFSIGNEAYGMQKVQYDAADVMTDRALAAMAPALDDLRRLGEADLQLNHTAQAIP